MTKVTDDSLAEFAKAGPAVLRFLRAHFGPIRFVGNHASWSDAEAASANDPAVTLAAVQRATARARDGEGFERDAMFFERCPSSAFPVVSAALRVAAERGGALDVIDFGGALGSSYFSAKPWLSGLTRVAWRVVELPHFVTEGKARFESEQLRFHTSIENALREGPASLVILSGVIHFLPAPFDVLRAIFAHGVEHVLLDRVPILTRCRVERRAAPSLLTVQHIRGNFEGTFPSWFFDADDFAAALAPYETLVEFDSFEAYSGKGFDSQARGYFLRREALAGSR